MNQTRHELLIVFLLMFITALLRLHYGFCRFFNKPHFDKILSFPVPGSISNLAKPKKYATATATAAATATATATTTATATKTNEKKKKMRLLF